MIRASNGSVISLSFSLFDVEAIWDDVRIYDGADASAPLLLAASNGEPKGLPPNVVSTSNKMYVRLLSDVLVNGKGFVATYFQVKSIQFVVSLIANDKNVF